MDAQLVTFMTTSLCALAVALGHKRRAISAGAANLTIDDVKGTPLSPEEGQIEEGQVMFSQVLEQDALEDWRRARNSTHPVRLGLDRSVAALRVADFLSKHVEFWAEEVVRELITRVGVVEEIEQFADSLGPAGANDDEDVEKRKVPRPSRSPTMRRAIMLAWDNMLISASMKVRNESLVSIRSEMIAIDVMPVFKGDCMFVPVSCHMIMPGAVLEGVAKRSRPLRIKVHEIQIDYDDDDDDDDYPDAQHCNGASSEKSLSLTDYSIHPKLMFSCVESAVAFMERIESKRRTRHNSDGDIITLMDRLPLLAAKTLLDILEVELREFQEIDPDEIGVGEVQEYMSIAFLSHSLISSVENLPRAYQPASRRAVVPSCEELVAILKKVNGGLWELEAISGALAMMDRMARSTTHMASKQEIDEFHPLFNIVRDLVEGEDSYHLRLKWGRMLRHEHGSRAAVMYRLWIAMRDTIFPRNRLVGKV